MGVSPTGLSHRPGELAATASATLALVAVLAACVSPASSGSEPASQELPSASAGRSLPATPSVSSAASGAPAAPLAWSRLEAAGPAEREDHSWTVDPDGTFAYLFGGRDGGTALADLWAYDLASDAWTELAPPSGPSSRFGHEAAWIDGVGLVIFAGQSGATFFNDLWAYDADANTWAQLPSDGAQPVARYGSCSAVGQDGRLWISHGFTSDGTRFADTRAYDFTAGSWTDETPSGEHPVERCLHACWWTDRGELTLYAGQTTGVAALGDRWALGEDGWTRFAGALPPERNLPAHARLDGTTIVFGGRGLDLAFRSDVWLLGDGAEDAVMLTPAGAAPEPRAGAALVVDSARDRVLLFGGRAEDGAFADTWALGGIEEGT
ncbi:MAG TPA: kelch repeat-containing protein [Candidatus Limnocylindria bacterium]